MPAKQIIRSPANFHLFNTQKTRHLSLTRPGRTGGHGLIKRPMVSLPVPIPSMVAGGYGTNQIATSPDGIKWTASANGNSIFTTSCRCVAWNGSIWVAGGNGTNTIATSPDGITWTGRGSIFTTLCSSVAWNGTKWVAGGSGTVVYTSGGYISHINLAIATSPDGITWAPINTTSILTQCLCLASNGSKWVAGGTNGNSGAIAYSTDNGITWNASTSTSGNLIFTFRCNSVAWNGSMWVAGGAGTNKIATSPDGITWTESTSGNSIFTVSCNGVAWNGSKWVAVGTGNSGEIAYSTDGITWTESTSTSGGSVFATQCNSVAWNGSIWVAGGNQQNITNTIATSPDGITWSASTSGNSIITTICLTVASKVSPIITP